MQQKVSCVPSSRLNVGLGNRENNVIKRTILHVEEILAAHLTLVCRWIVVSRGKWMNSCSPAVGSALNPENQ